MNRSKRVMAVVLIAVLMVTMYICIADKAYWFSLGQYAYNIIFLMMIMPACVVGLLRTYGLDNI